MILAVFERELIRERTRTGMAAAKLTRHDLDTARRLIVAGWKKPEVAETLRVGRSTLRWALIGDR